MGNLWQCKFSLNIGKYAIIMRAASNAGRSSAKCNNENDPRAEWRLKLNVVNVFVLCTSGFSLETVLLHHELLTSHVLMNNVRIVKIIFKLHLWNLILRRGHHENHGVYNNIWQNSCNLSTSLYVYMGVFCDHLMIRQTLAARLALGTRQVSPHIHTYLAICWGTLLCTECMHLESCFISPPCL